MALVETQCFFSAFQTVEAKLINTLAEKSREEAESHCQELKSREQVTAIWLIWLLL